MTICDNEKKIFSFEMSSLGAHGSAAGRVGTPGGVGCI